MVKQKKMVVSKNDDLIAKRRRMVNELVKVQGTLDSQCRSFEEKINELKTSVPLTVYLKQIINVLKKYEEDRSSNVGSGLFSSSIRTDKINMVARYREQFESLVLDIPDECKDYAPYAERAFSIYEAFDAEHKNRVGKLGIRSGKLGDSLKEVGTISKSFHSDPKFDETVSFMRAVINKIKQSFGFAKNDSHTPEFRNQAAAG